MSKQVFADISCSIARAVDVIGQRWTPLIVRDLFAGMTKFEDIRRDLGIASNILAARLDELERNGVVDRRQYQSAPARHEYVLTDKGRDLYPVIATLLAFGDKWLSLDGPPALITHTDCGHVTTAKTVCAECGGELNAANAIHSPGPGANPGRGTALIGNYLRR
jgi:DNA-binding HxlR family transcriptional regulator